jgi:hypothetical protein
MSKSNTIAISIALVSVATALFAWLAAPDRIAYEVKFVLVLLAVASIVTAIVLPMRASRFEKKQRTALDSLSEHIDWAIHHLLNRPRPQVTEVNAFAATLSQDFDDWCARVDTILKDESLFTRSDLTRFQRLGFIDPVIITGHASVDHTFSMLKLKLKRLQEVIDSVQQKAE